MKSFSQLIEKTIGHDHQSAYIALQKLEEYSIKTSEIAVYLPQFLTMMQDENSYIRTRGMRLFAVNSRWLTKAQLQFYLPAYLTHLQDESPIVIRQCIQSLALFPIQDPDIQSEIRNALASIHTAPYKESMRQLIQKDIQIILSNLEATQHGMDQH